MTFKITIGILILILTIGYYLHWKKNKNLDKKINKKIKEVFSIKSIDENLHNIFNPSSSFAELQALTERRGKFRRNLKPFHIILAIATLLYIIILILP